MKKSLKRLIVAAVFGVGCLAQARPASADTISVDDFVRFLGSDGTLGGGAFQLDNLATGIGFDFLTFCVQRTQFIDYSNQFRVGNISNAADDNPSDPLSLQTAWIYSQFRQGGLAGVYNSDAIQAAIWIFENEWTTDVGNSAALRAAAVQAVLGGWTNDGVSVITLFYADGRQAQDQLTFTAAEVPEPASLVLLGTGLAALARVRRRRGHAAPVS